MKGLMTAIVASVAASLITEYLKKRKPFNEIP